MADEVANFTVLALECENGPVIMKPPNSLEYTYIASAINIALSILASEQARGSLIELTARLDAARPPTLGGPMCYGNTAAVRTILDVFLRKIRAQFPPVVINHTMDNIDILGTTLSPPWEGNPNEFHPRRSMIYLNGSRVSDMLAAVNQGDGQLFGSFQFLFATTLVHEAGGHVLSSFLLQGHIQTPTHISAPGYGNTELQLGESGRWLEMRLFGGTTEYYRDPSQDDQQTGIPYQLDNAGRAWKLHASNINDVCQYRFTLPFQRTGGPVNCLAMQSMGRNPYPESDSSHRAMQARQIQIYRSVNPAHLEGFTVHLRELRAIPMRPHQEVRVV